MNRYLMVCRLRWPAILLLTGVIALLDQAGILSWGRAWPLYLILFGVMALAERALLASEPPPPMQYPVYPGSGYPATGYAPAGYAQPGYPPQAAPETSTAATAPSTGIVPVSNDLSIRTNHDEEGR